MANRIWGKVQDPRTKQYLVDVEYPARWTPESGRAKDWSKGVLKTLAKTWPYLEDCVFITVEKVSGCYSPLTEVIGEL